MSRINTPADLPEINDEFQESDKQGRLCKWLIWIDIWLVAVAVLAGLQAFGVPLV